MKNQVVCRKMLIDLSTKLIDLCLTFALKTNW